MVKTIIALTQTLTFGFVKGLAIMVSSCIFSTRKDKGTNHGYLKGNEKIAKKN